MQNVSIIVAMSDNGTIGHDNRLLWHLPNDLKHFKALTVGKPVIMGRKTFESIGKPLPNRQNIVLTRSNVAIDGVQVVHSVREALQMAHDAPEVMVIGGGEIYRLFFPLATCMYVTYVHVQLSGEVSFLTFEPEQWREVSRERNYQDDKHVYDYSFVTYRRSHLVNPVA